MEATRFIALAGKGGDGMSHMSSQMLPLNETRVSSRNRSAAARCLLVAFTIALNAARSCEAQNTFPPVAESVIRRIEAPRISQQLVIDGRLDEKAWMECAASSDFVDLISGSQAIHSTRVKVLWDEINLYVGYAIEEPDVQAKFTQRDSPIYQDNDVEIFIAGEDAYYEFEINALGTVYEGLFVWQSNYESSGLARLPSLDRSRPEVRWQPFNGVGFKNHPRGLRWAFLDWDFPGAQFATHVDGTLNDPSDRDRGWTVELAFPWQEMRILNRSRPRKLPPQPGEIWRIDFSRFNQYKEAPPAKDSGGWALSYHAVWDSHIPECFPYVTFVAESSLNTREK